MFIAIERATLTMGSIILWSLEQKEENELSISATIPFSS